MVQHVVNVYSLYTFALQQFIIGASSDLQEILEIQIYWPYYNFDTKADHIYWEVYDIVGVWRYKPKWYTFKFMMPVMYIHQNTSYI